MPDYLDKLPGAQAVWFEEIERVIARGISADQSSTFASYCVIEAALRAVAVTGELPTAAVFKERRMLAEHLGICGVKASTALPSNAFAENPYGALPDA